MITCNELFHRVDSFLKRYFLLICQRYWNLFISRFILLCVYSFMNFKVFKNFCITCLRCCHFLCCSLHFSWLSYMQVVPMDVHNSCHSCLELTFSSVLLNTNLFRRLLFLKVVCLFCRFRLIVFRTRNRFCLFWNTRFHGVNRLVLGFEWELRWLIIIVLFMVVLHWHLKVF